MKIVGKNGLGNILKIILQICFWGGITFLITLGKSNFFFSINVNNVRMKFVLSKKKE